MIIVSHLFPFNWVCNWNKWHFCEKYCSCVIGTGVRTRCDFGSKVRKGGKHCGKDSAALMQRRKPHMTPQRRCASGFSLGRSTRPHSRTLACSRTAIRSPSGLRPCIRGLLLIYRSRRDGRLSQHSWHYVLLCSLLAPVLFRQVKA